MKQEAEESGSTSSAAENVVEKGEVEATKESEKEKDNKNNDGNEKEVDVADKEKDPANEQEVVFIQDMGFTVKIVSPGSEPFDIQVSSMELVQVIVRLSMMKYCRPYTDRKEYHLFYLIINYFINESSFKTLNLILLILFYPINQLSVTILFYIYYFTLYLY